MSLTDPVPLRLPGTAVCRVTLLAVYCGQSVYLPLQPAHRGWGRTACQVPIHSGPAACRGRDSERQKCTATRQMPTMSTRENATQFPALPGAPGSPSMTGKHVENPEMSALRSPTIPDAWISTSKGVPIWCLDFVICDRRKLGSGIMLSSWPVPREHALPPPTASPFSSRGDSCLHWLLCLLTYGYQMAMTELVSSAVSPELRGKQQRIPRICLTAVWPSRNCCECCLQCL